MHDVYKLHLAVQGTIYNFMNTAQASTFITAEIGGLTAALGAGYWAAIDEIINMIYDLGLWLFWINNNLF